MARQFAIRKDVNAGHFNTFQLMVHMILSVCVSIHLSSMTGIAKCVKNKSAQTIVKDLEVPGRVHAARNTTNM